MSGIVWIDGQLADKPGTQVSAPRQVEIKGNLEPFVSRGGRKLRAALDAFEIDPHGWTCLDVGVSTGGFTDCLLQAGAARVYAVDVGYGQLDFKLRSDPRVEVRERVNARHLSSEVVPEPCRLVVMDLSFISAAKVVPAVIPLMTDEGQLIVLVKPQFEGRREQIGKGGIVRDEKVRKQIVRTAVEAIAGCGLSLAGLIESPVHGAKGNVESLALFLRVEADDD